MMNKVEDWEKIYEIWKTKIFHYSYEPISTFNSEIIRINYDSKSNYSYIWGFDWLSISEVENQKALIKQDIDLFLLSEPTNKGTVHTATMLSEAKNEEEIAAIWIAATSYEIMNKKNNHEFFIIAEQLYLSSLLFLREIYITWHHAMRKLVPDIMISYSFFDHIQNLDYETMIELIQMNMLILKGSYKILLYTSRNSDEVPQNKSTRIIKR